MGTDGNQIMICTCINAIMLAVLRGENIAVT